MSVLPLAASGCSTETAHPSVKITFEFEGESYSVEYTLYRNMYPHTVRHFIELADSGFYNNMLIHNYTANDWFTGGYSYDETSYANAKEMNGLSDYLESHSKDNSYISLFENGKLSASVYGEGPGKADFDNPYPTLIGEFYNNIHQEIEKGALSDEYGCLKMFYYTKETTQHVYVLPTSDQQIVADYKTNCATSLFALQVGTTSTYTSKDYCVFAKVNDIGAFDDFVEAVRESLTNEGDSMSDYSDAYEVIVDGWDEWTDKQETDRNISQTFHLTHKPIIVKKVEVTGY